MGDVYATSIVLRLLSVAEAALGFALFTVAVAITYVLSVFSALQRSTSSALEVARYLHAEFDDAVETLASLLHQGQDEELSDWLAQFTVRLVEAAQA